MLCFKIYFTEKKGGQIKWPMKNCPYIYSCDVKGQIEEPILPKKTIILI
jgi:hypothetical protein